ncbi:hypothetical protein ACB098_06G119000 [Castanea mollissima]
MLPYKHKYAITLFFSILKRMLDLLHLVDSCIVEFNFPIISIMRGANFHARDDFPALPILQLHATASKPGPEILYLFHSIESPHMIYLIPFVRKVLVLNGEYVTIAYQFNLVPSIVLECLEFHEIDIFFLFVKL